MVKQRTLRVLALVGVLAMFAAACGQKDGVHVGFAPQQPGQAQAGQAGADPQGGAGGYVVDGDGFVDPETGEPGDQPVATGQAGTTGPDDGSGTGPAAPTGGSAQEPTAGGTTGNGQTTGTTGTTGSTGTSGGTTGSAGGDWRGVTDTEIRIGLHAPLSGAAPLPQASFQTGKDQYWHHVGKVHGRDVVVIVRDDQYNPSRGRTVCDDLIQREEVYLLIGGGGTDQITACARTAAAQGVPYLSAGVDEGLLRQLPNYFALSMSYLQQAPLLVKWVQRNAPPSNNRFGILRDRTPGFNAVVQRVKEEAERAGFEVHVRQHQNGPSDAQWLTQHNIEVAFPIMAPSQFLQVVGSPGGAINQWAGIGITMGLNTVVNFGCRAASGYDGAMFFSPFPGLNQIDRLDPNFKQAGGDDDIELALWGLNKTIHEVLKKMSADDLSRGAFIRAIQSNIIETNVYPQLRHSAENHFGAQSVHLLFADCSQGVNVTPDDGLFRNSF